MDTPGTFHRLHPNVRTVWIIGDLIVTIFVAVVTIGAELWMGGLWGVWPGVFGAGVFILLSWFVVAFSRWQYDAASYACREHDVVVAHGVWWKKRVCIPRLRVQHVDIESGPIERKLGLCHLSIHTAGNPMAAAKIEGLEPQRAEDLRAELIGERATQASAAPEQNVQGEGFSEPAPPPHDAAAMESTPPPSPQPPPGWTGGPGA